MKTYRDLLALGTVLPCLMAPAATLAATTTPERPVSVAAPETLRLAQAEPNPDELRRKGPPGGIGAPGGQGGRPPAPGVARPPSGGMAPTRPPTDAMTAPARPPVGAMPAPTRPPAGAMPAPTRPPIGAMPAPTRPMPSAETPPAARRAIGDAPPATRRLPGDAGAGATRPSAPAVERPSVPVGVSPTAPTAPVVPKAPTVTAAPPKKTGPAPTAVPLGAPPSAGPAPGEAPSVPMRKTGPAPSAVPLGAPAIPGAGAPPANAGSSPMPPAPGAPSRPPAPGAVMPGGGAPIVPGEGRPATAPGADRRLPPQGVVRPGPAEGGPRPVGPGAGPAGGPGVGPALGAAAVGAAVGVVGGMMLGGEARALDDVHRQRRETVRDGSTYYSEPGRVIIRDESGLHMRHDETERFRAIGGESFDERRGDELVRVWVRPDGVRIITVTDADGRLLRRIRRWPDGREEILIDNGFRPRPRDRRDWVVTLPPPPVPPSRWYVDAEGADEEGIWETLRAPPLAPLPRRYSLDEVRESRDLRSYMPAVDLDTITFETGSWSVEDSQIARLDRIARSLSRIIAANPEEIFLVEGHTDAVGSDVDNLSLSDRRAQSVATILTRNFGIPAENLVTQGYGEQVLKEATEGPSRINRRVTVRRITPLLGSAADR